MVTCPKRIVQCGVPGCLDVIRQSEMVVNNRDNARKHLDLYAIDEQTKAWSLKEVRILLLTIVNQFTYHTADRTDSLLRTFLNGNLLGKTSMFSVSYVYSLAANWRTLKQ